ncbi:MAG: response regulator [Pyrinomonadaceae bacterium]
MNNIQPKTILVAEDHADSLAMVSSFLEQKGYKVVEARDGREAVEKAHLSRPDLILMDLNMPYMSGIEAAFLIRQNSELSQVPILATSAKGEYGIELFSKIDKFGKGFIGYLTKPLNLNDLAEQIKEALC